MMGPLELQLNRELAVQMVRECARLLQVTDTAHGNNVWFERWFERLHADWSCTPRAELGGLTPTQAIERERARLRQAGHPDEPSVAQRIEVYTDLPQGDFAATSMGEATLLEEPSEVRREPGDEVHAGVDEAVAAVDRARWRAFCQQHLGWLSDHLR
jgi:hypothetical protein